MSGLSPTLAMMREGPQYNPPIDDDEDTIVLDPQDEPNGKPSIVIDFPDGSVNIYTGGGPAADLSKEKFNANLAEKLGETYLNTLADELLRGIEEDDQSRKEWLEDRAEGIKLLALKIEKPSGAQGGSSAGVDNTSRTRHTLLLEAALRFQANARSELLPTDGPVKIENSDGTDVTEGDDLAAVLEDDMNYYLTVTASEYVPDTDRMLLWTGFGGSGFKKVYRCPIRRRPVSESVDAEKVIVSNAATDLGNADRVTIEDELRPSVMKRMMLLKVYRDVDLATPSTMPKSAVDEQKEEVAGVRASQNPEDASFPIYECYCNIVLEGDEHKEGGEISGLPLPYKVTIERSNRQILEIRRNWHPDDEMQRPRETFVKFPFVPGFGFYDLGLLQIAGNPTVAATALLRIMIDNGIFSNFPGGLTAKSTDKQNTTDISVPPGGFAPIDTSMIQDGDIRKAVMPLPYQPTNAATMALFQDIVTTGSRVAGAADIAVGEGRQDAPVGTTLALIEQATKIVDAVHKRLHSAQQKEFELIVELFRDNPEDFWRFNKKKNRGWKWDTSKLQSALNDYNLVPRADPNTSSHTQRIMRAQALYQMAKANPELFQVNAVLDYVLRTLGIRNPDALTVAPSVTPPTPSPQDEAKLLSAQAQQMGAQAKLADVQLRAKNMGIENQNRDLDRSADLKIAATKLKTEQTIHGQSLAADAASQAREQRHDMAKHVLGLGAASQDNAAGLHADMTQHMSGLASDHALAQQDHVHEAKLASQQAKVSAAGRARKRGGRVNADHPPMAGARKAPDGHWYIRHNTTGQFYRVEPKDH